MTVESVTPEEVTTPHAAPCKPFPDIPALPSTDISRKSEVREMFAHILTTLADWDKMSDEAESTDPDLMEEHHPCVP